MKRHLSDAGLSEGDVAAIISCMLDGNQSECLHKLEIHRVELLNEIHRERYCIEKVDEMLRDFGEAYHHQ